jgi:hypothetical protein
MSADGKRVFFESPDQLVSGDTNSVVDVYEWEVGGSGSCPSGETEKGCIYLISSGRGSSPSSFVDASASGDDVFFLTATKLVGQDQDELVDVYDARVNGGLEAQDPDLVAPCSGEACRSGSTTASSGATAGSGQFSGPPNPAAKHKKKKHHRKAKHSTKQKKPHKKKHHDGRHSAKNHANQGHKGGNR